jgi:hypothetical protein
MGILVSVVVIATLTGYFAFARRALWRPFAVLAGCWGTLLLVASAVVNAWPPRLRTEMPCSVTEHARVWHIAAGVGLIVVASAGARPDGERSGSVAWGLTLACVPVIGWAMWDLVPCGEPALLGLLAYAGAWWCLATHLLVRDRHLRRTAAAGQVSEDTR